MQSRQPIASSTILCMTVPQTQSQTLLQPVAICGHSQFYCLLHLPVYCYDPYILFKCWPHVIMLTFLHLILVLILWMSNFFRNQTVFYEMTIVKLCWTLTTFGCCVLFVINWKCWMLRLLKILHHQHLLLRNMKKAQNVPSFRSKNVPPSMYFLSLWFTPLVPKCSNM